MKKPNKQSFCAALALLTAFLLWTAAVRTIDVQAIGPQASPVGMATLNRAVHRFTGVHMTLYTVTDWLGLVPLACVCAFAGLGLVQWIQRKRLSAVDHSVLLLGSFYLLVLTAYVFFEQCVVNYRPVLIEGILEASYPSSTTMLALTVMPTAAMQINTRIRRPACRRIAVACILVFTVFMVVGRLFSGVHWVSDIIGGILLSAGLVLLYAAVSG